MYIKVWHHPCHVITDPLWNAGQTNLSLASEISHYCEEEELRTTRQVINRRGDQAGCESIHFLRDCDI